MPDPRAILMSALFGLAGLLAVPSGPARAEQVPADLTRSLAYAPSGQLRMGYDKAPVQLAILASFGCADCQALMQHMPSLRALVRLGLVSFELTHAISSPIDAAAAAIAQCTAPARFFDVTEAIYAAQINVVAAEFLLSEEIRSARARGAPLGEEDFLDRAAHHAGLYGIAAEQGISRARSCVTNTALVEKIMSEQSAMARKGAGRMPAFFINDTPVPASGWADLWPQLVSTVAVRNQVGSWDTESDRPGHCRMTSEYEKAILMVEIEAGELVFLAYDAGWEDRGTDPVPVSLIAEGQLATRMGDWDAPAAGVRAVRIGGDAASFMETLSRSGTWSILLGGAKPALTRFATRDGLEAASARMQACAVPAGGGN